MNPSAAEEEEWHRLLECVICLEITRRPVRPWHEPPLHRDCGVVLCPDCFDRWRRMPHPRCPKCRADVVSLGMSANGPLVGGGGQPDPVLMRLMDEILPVESQSQLHSKSVPFHPIPTAACPPTPNVIADHHRRPVEITAMQDMLRTVLSVCQTHRGFPRDNGDGIGGSRPVFWTDDVVTTTTLVVDDHEALTLPRSFPHDQQQQPLRNLDSRLGWSRRLGWSPERTVQTLVELGLLLPPPSAPALAPGWITRSLTVDVRGIWFVRILAGSLVALVRWVRDHATDTRAQTLLRAVTATVTA